MKKLTLFAFSFLLGLTSPDCLSQAGTKFNTSVFGENVFVFDPSMNMKDVQAVLDTIFSRQTGRKGEFTTGRYAFLFKPGRYDLDMRIDYYMQALGLGISPDDVVIHGAVRSNTTMWNSVLCNFWRAVENMAIEPVKDTMVWGVSQAAPLRRVHVKGNLQLFDKGYASGGFLADSRIDGTISSGPQQQWFTRNSAMRNWTGSNWNMMFMGVSGAPEENFAPGAYTTIEKVPLIREKPYLAYDNKGFCVKVPALKENSVSFGWSVNTGRDKTVYLNEFYIAKPAEDNSAAINLALENGKNILITPGRYYLKESLKIRKPGTIMMGIGLASLIPVNGNIAVEIADVDGVSVCGLTVDAGPVFSGILFQVGQPGSSRSHSMNPSFLYDLFFRVGGPARGSAGSCLVVNSNNVYIDHTWLWRADHGNGVGWNSNMAANGLVVNGNSVTVYGLFNEHFQEYQTLWNGNSGRVYFYQSEMPYDPPTVDSWKHGNTYGFASYKVADNVTSHEAWGLGIYNVFYDAPVLVDQAIEVPSSLENKIHNKIIFWLNGNKESVVRSVINGKGGEINVNHRKAIMK